MECHRLLYPPRLLAVMLLLAHHLRIPRHTTPSDVGHSHVTLPTQSLEAPPAHAIRVTSKPQVEPLGVGPDSCAGQCHSQRSPCRSEQNSCDGLDRMRGDTEPRKWPSRPSLREASGSGSLHLVWQSVRICKLSVESYVAFDEPHSTSAGMLCRWKHNTSPPFASTCSRLYQEDGAD